MIFFGIILIYCCVAATIQANNEVLRELQLTFRGSSPWASTNWDGRIYCPMDYGIDTLSFTVTKGYTTVPFQPKDDISETCKSRNYCYILIFENTNVGDGNVLTANYSCISLLELNLFKNKLVERFNYDPDVSVVRYCRNEPRRKRNGHITATGSMYSIDDFIVTRRFYAQNRIRGYTIEQYLPDARNVMRTIMTRTRRHADGSDITVPVYIAANITFASIRPSAGRTTFTPDVRRYLDRAGIRRSGNNADDGGHLVAYTLGGEDSANNLVPMARDLNRIQGIWYRNEAIVRNYLTAHQDSMVSWEVLLHYGIRSEEPYRPIAFTLRFRMFSNLNDLQNYNEQIECFINENEHYRNAQCSFDWEDMFRPLHQHDPNDD